MSSCLNRTLNFVGKHKKKFLLGTAIVCVGAGIYTYWKQQESSTSPKTNNDKVSEIGDEEELRPEEEEEERLRKRVQFFFEENKKTVDNGFRTGLPAIRKNVMNMMDLERISGKLRTGEILQEEKRNLWERLKVESFTRSVGSVYALCLSYSFFGMQVNIISRHIFLSRHFDEKIKQNPDIPLQAPLELNDQIKREFLSFAEYFQSNGLKQLLDRIHKYAHNHISRLSLKEVLDAPQICEMIKNIKQEFEEEAEAAAIPDDQADIPFSINPNNLVTFMLPEENPKDGTNSLTLNLLLDEMRDYLESHHFFVAFKELADNAFNVLFSHTKDMVAAVAQKKLQKSQKQQEGNQEQGVSCFLANVVPKIVNETKLILDGDLSNEYILTMENSPGINDILANIFTDGIINR